MTDPFGQQARRPLLGTVALAAVILLAGCSGGAAVDDAAASATPPVASGVTPNTAPTSAVGAASSADTPPAPPAGSLAAPDAATLLAAALAAAGPGYHFVTTVTTGDDVALQAEGDRIGEATRLTVTSNDVSVEYIISPDGSWAAQDGVWQELTQDAPPSDPLAALSNPADLQVIRFDEQGATLTGSYPANVLGVEGDQSIIVAIDVVGGALQSLSYAAPGGAQVTTVRTVLGPVVSTAPITTPDVS